MKKVLGEILVLQVFEFFVLKCYMLVILVNFLKISEDWFVVLNENYNLSSCMACRLRTD